MAQLFFFGRKTTTDSKNHIKIKRGDSIAKIPLKKKNDVGGLTLPDLKTYKATVLQRAQCGEKGSGVQPRTEQRAPVRRHTWATLVFDKGAKAIYWGNKTTFL